MRETIEQLKAENALLKAQIKKESTESLLQQLEMEQVITTISTRFVHVEADLFQTEIENALKKIGIQAGIDRSYLFLYNHEKDEMNNTHEWCAAGISKEIDNLKNLPKSLFPWWNKKIEENQFIRLFSLNDLPEEATEEKKILKNQHIKSLLVVPVFNSGKAIGFMGFDSVKKHKSWSDSDIRMLHLIADMLGNTFKRIETQEKLLKSEARYRSLIESTQSSVFVADSSGKILFANSIAQKNWNLQPEDITEKKISDLFPEKQAKTIISDIHHVLSAKDRKVNETILHFKNTECWYRTTIEPLDEGKKLPDKGLVFFDNIDEDKKNALRIKQLNKRLIALNKIDKAIIHQFGSKNNFFQTALMHLYPLIPCHVIVFATMDYQTKTGEAKAIVLKGKPYNHKFKAVRFEDMHLNLMKKNRPFIKNLRKDNLDSNFQRWIYERKIRNYLILPVNFKNKPVGALILLSKNNNYFTEEHTKIVNKISQQIIIGYQQFILKEQIQRQNKKLEQLIETRTREKDEISLLNNAIVNTTRAIIFSVSTDGTILTMNPVAEKLLGYQSSEVVHIKTMDDFYNPEELSSLHREMQKKTGNNFENSRELFIHIAKNESNPIEFNLITKKGDSLPVLLSINAIHDKTGHVKQYAGVATSLEYKKEAEKALQLQQKAFKNFVYALVITDRDGKLLWANSAYEHLTGFSFKESAGKNVEELQKSARNNPELYKNLWETILNKNTWKGEIMHEKKDGTTYPEDLTISPITNQKGEITHFVAIKIDITEKKNLEKYSLIQRDLGFALATATTLREALKKVLKYILKLEGINAAGIYLTNPETGNYELKISSGLSADFIEKTKKYTPGTPEFKIVKKGIPFYKKYTECKKHSTFVLFQKENFQQIGVIPIKYNNRIIGSVNVASRVDKGTEWPVRFILESIAAQIGSALTRIKSQDALLFSQKNFQLMFNTIEDFVFISDTNKKIIQTNPVAEKRLGYTAEELHGMSILNLHPPEGRAKAKAIIHEMLAGKKITYSVPLYTKDKKQIPVETKVVLGKWDGKNAIYGISRDISERLKAEKKIRSNKARWQFALESSGDGIWDWRTQTNKVFFSTQWKKMLGYEESEISNSLEEWKKRIHPEDIKEVESNLDAHFKGKTSIYKNEYRLLCKDGRYKWILDRGKIINRDAKGNPERIVGTHTDISTRKYVENSMTQALQEEKELNKLKSQFVSMASHEFRTPLATMIMAAETLELYWNKMSKEEITVKIARIKNNVKFLRNIMEKTLNLSRLQSGNLKFEPVATDLNQFIKEIIKHLKPTYNSHKINYSGTKAPLNIEIDRQMMKQVIHNLLTNSFKYSEAGTTVKVNISTGDSTVLIKITDEGIGIPESEKNNVFVAFQRCSNVGNIHGTGLGMALANQFVQHHGGNITFKSEINKGTTFIISLPNLHYS